MHAIDTKYKYKHKINLNININLNLNINLKITINLSININPNINRSINISRRIGICGRHEKKDPKPEKLPVIKAGQFWKILGWEKNGKTFPKKCDILLLSKKAKAGKRLLSGLFV